MISTVLFECWSSLSLFLVSSWNCLQIKYVEPHLMCWFSFCILINVPYKYNMIPIFVSHDHFLVTIISEQLHHTEKRNNI